MRTAIRLALASAALASTANRAAAQHPVLSVEGVCPGEVRMIWDGAEPDRTAALVFSRSLGSFTISGPCSGTVLGLGTDGLRLHLRFRTGPEGTGEMLGRANPYSCGGYLQIVVVGNPCTTSNVAQIP